MGPRPPDFDEELVRKSPTFKKWEGLQDGQKLKYACREFEKGVIDEDERLMRRIMIARRNNIRDHKVLIKAREITYKKKVRQQQRPKVEQPEQKSSSTAPVETAVDTKSIKQKQILVENEESKNTNNGYVTNENNLEVQQQQDHQRVVDDHDDHPLMRRRRRPTTIFSDAQLAQEMDVPAVEATRSYRTWSNLPDGAEFTYNQKFIKGWEGHDWLLRKNIWRRMRYRRDNKKMMEEVLNETTDNRRSDTSSTTSRGAPAGGGSTTSHPNHQFIDSNPNNNHNNGISTASHIVDQALLTAPSMVMAGKNPSHHHHHTHHHDPDNTTAAAVATAASLLDGSTEHDVESAAAVEAAVAAAESYAMSSWQTNHVVHNPLEVTNTTTDAGLGLALDAAARLAAATAGSSSVDESTLDVAATDDAIVLAAATAAAVADPTLHVQPHHNSYEV
jgi:hypothetical protein